MEPMSHDDSDELYEAIVSRDEVMRWLATGRAGTWADAKAMCQEHVVHWDQHGYGDFAVRDPNTRAFLGRVGLRNRPDFGVDLGFAIHPQAQGRGVASEAGRACLDLAFSQLQLPSVLAFALPGNQGSIAVLTRLGAHQAGTVVSSGNRCLRFRFDPDISNPERH
jgi:RimJ/RimL family protein N-acetyltransferase